MHTSQIQGSTVSGDFSHYDFKKLKSVMSNCNSPSEMTTQRMESNYSKNELTLRSNVSSSKENQDIHKRIGSLSRQLPVSLNPRDKVQSRKNRNVSHRRSKPLFSIHQTKGIKNKLSNKNSTASQFSEY
jgi:hypothetical protein